jgi:hypothetical protein
VTTMTDEEHMINALPPELQQRMARLVLAGWSIRRIREPVNVNVTWGHDDWVASRPAIDWARVVYKSSTLLTLLTLLNKMDKVI